MKKNRFLLLFVFALFVFLPFGVNAEVNSVKKIGNRVYVGDNFEMDIKCSGVQEPEYYSLGVENLIEIYDLSDDEEYIYNFTTKECRLMTEEESDKYWAEEPSVSYEVRDNKLYKIETDDMFRQFYVEVSFDEIVDGGIYYQSPEPAEFEEVSSDVCLNSSTVCYEQKDLYQINVYKNDGNKYYLYEGYKIVSPLFSEPESDNYGIYIEVNRDDYVKETVIIDNVSEFESKAKLSMSLSEIIDAENNGDAVLVTLTFNNKEYIYTYYNEDEKLVTNLYSSDGFKVETDFVYGEFKVVGKYLVGAGYKDANSSTISMIYYNANFENVYEVNNLELDNLPNPIYFTNYQNSTIIQLENEVETDDGYDTIYNYIAIKEYELLQGENQKYENNSLTFKANGDYSLFKNIEINGIELDKNNYVIEEGSTIVTLKNDYLKTLENGTYTMKINYNDGGYVETTFTVEKNNDVSTFKVIFDANGGIFKNNKETIEIEDIISFDYNEFEKPTRDGYRFVGFYTKDGKSYYEVMNSEAGVEEDITFYAKWKKIKSTESGVGNSIEQEIKNPDTSDNIMSSILMGTISLIGLVGTIVYLKKRNKVRV